MKKGRGIGGDIYNIDEPPSLLQEKKEEKNRNHKKHRLEEDPYVLIPTQITTFSITYSIITWQEWKGVRWQKNTCAYFTKHRTTRSAKQSSLPSPTHASTPTTASTMNHTNTKIPTTTVLTVTMCHHPYQDTTRTQILQTSDRTPPTITTKYPPLTTETFKKWNAQEKCFCAHIKQNIFSIIDIAIPRKI